jgi:triosephosphate isomerase
MRKKIIAGNWKMYKTIQSGSELISVIKNELLKNPAPENVLVVVCPPFTSLDSANALLKGSKIGLGAQNMFYETEGAFTGEISGEMLKAVGCEYVILGHSERRTYFYETDEMINKKIKKALDFELIPIFCIGETLQEREEGKTFDIVNMQIQKGLEGLTSAQVKNIIIAYEPVWAIGTGKTATPEQAQEVHKYIRDLLADMFDKSVAENVVIQYGGSVKPENAKSLLSQPDIDGALVGGACLKAESFLSIIKSAY